MKAPSRKTVGILGGLTVVAFLLALGTFDVYLAILAQLLLLATIVCGVLAFLRRPQARHPQPN